MQFIDIAKISIKAGNGGNGCVSFRREKFVPKGGPDGGNGGRGGHVILRADKQLNTLLDFKYRQHYKAEKGENGKGKNQTGRNGEDIILKVPCGTIVKDSLADEVTADLIKHEEETIVAYGGRGGRGNAEFATSTNQAPRRFEPGEKGEERELVLELKLLADVGLVGFPNAGKSTLISVVSAAKPKIADYPFTTLVPNLGIVRIDIGKTFTMADLPGLIEGAHEGKGLGIQFLRHIERTSVLAFLIESISENPKDDYQKLLNELTMYDSALEKRKKLIVITKMDLVGTNGRKILKKFSFGRGIPVFLICAISGEGIQELVAGMWKRLKI